jgi:adenylate cyclase
VRQALAIADEQHSPALRLRALTSLARLATGRGRGEALAALAEAYSAFDEGFETADLREAAAVLEGVEGGTSAGGRLEAARR